jgi:hypothetical protein
MYMYATKDLRSNLVTSVALGVTFSTFKEVSLITVVTIKKKSNINTMSGKAAVFTAG